jgi:predicted acyl esterase
VAIIGARDSGKSFARPLRREPDKPTRFAVEMMPLSVVVSAGHQLHITVSSSDYSTFARIRNTGGLIGKETRGQTVTNRIFHDHLRRSPIVLPVMRGRRL